ncbi:hypothetical protein GSY74_06645 [Sulfurovum sp. bin170]|uniref:hypothetical protein n=1 Tax=Sulfurovum sp. bin170 TaxID=2695268 RepID=UPI0013E0C1EC|nr:hypothetical protein [Sulfurovum sp. bin170]NEW60959.1 hypothetical protein [Sulfurovum sp. bin170]
MSIKSKIIILLFMLAMQGCVVDQPKFTVEEQKIAMPINNTTYFTGAFKKLNQLLEIYGQPNYKFQVKTIENMTSARQAMPMDSKAFLRTPLILHMNRLSLLAYEPIYNKYETQTTGFVYFPEMKKVMPELVINGSITQFDKGYISESRNFDLDLEFGSGRGDTDTRFDHDRSNSLSQIAMDLNIFKYKDRSYVSGVATQNKIIISRQRKKNRFGLFLNGSGIGYSKYATMQQSKDEALRILSEYSLIQLLGRLYQVPYWTCTTPHMKPDMEIIDKKVAQFSSAKKAIKFKLIERLIKFYGYKVETNGNISKEEFATLTKISKKYNFKSTEVLSADFYKELYTNSPIFN